MGIVIKYGRSRDDVRRWPGDPSAQRALAEYLDALPRESADVPEALDARRLDFTGADLSGLEFASADFSEATLSGVRLVGASLFSAWLIGTVLQGADLSQCTLRKAQGRNCDAQGAVLRGAEFQRSEFEYADFRRADLSGARFGSAWLAGADLRGANLHECAFGLNRSLTGLYKARLADCRIDGAVGMVTGPVDIGTDSPRLLVGTELQRWFAGQGAPQVEVRQIATS